jgi:uncharacterized protein (TIGR03437 family)
MQFQSLSRWVFLMLVACGSAAAQVPTIQRVVNAPSLTTPLCPGGIAAIIGTNLGPTTLFRGQATGLTVTVNGSNAPVYSSLATQLGIQIPFEVPPGPAIVVVKYFELTSAPFSIQLASVAPGILTAVQNGVAEPIFMRADGSMGSSQNPANPGETISIFMGGLGPTTPPTDTGVIPPFPVVTSNLVTETVSGEPAKVVFAALTNTLGQVGVYQVNFTVPRDLPSGSYPIVVTVRGVDSVAVLLPVANLGVATSQVGFTFQAVQGGSTPPPNTFRIINGMTRPVNFTVTPSTVSGGNWLSVSTTSGTIEQLGSTKGNTSAPITVSVNPGSMAPGDYYGSIRVDAPLALNSPQSLSIVMTIAPSTVSLGPVVQPSGLVFVQVEGDNVPASQSATITNLTNRAVSFTATPAVVGNLNWFTISTFIGNVVPNTPFPISVSINPGLRAGVYRGSLTLSFGASTRVIDLQLVVTPAVESENKPEDALTGRAAGGACTPTKLLPVFSLLGGGFSTSVAWPTSLEVNVVDDCGAPLKNGGVTASFSNGDQPVSLLSNGDGKWSGTWTAVNPRTSSLVVTADATQISSGLKGSTQIGGSAQPNPDVPILAANGVLNAGSFSLAATPSPGELVSIFGQNLADGFGQAQSLPLATSLQNATIVLGGRLLPLVFTVGGQINAQIPYDIPPGTVQQMIAQRGARLSVPQPVRIRSAEPAIFSTDSSGKGQGHIYAITAAGLQVLADASNPVTAGNVLVIYCTGLGNVDPAVVAGSAVPGDQLRNAVGPVTLTIGGVNASIAFAGLTPGLTGLYQVNVTVPPGITPGNQVPVVLSVDGSPGPPVTMAVK